MSESADVNGEASAEPLAETASAESSSSEPAAEAPSAAPSSSKPAAEAPSVAPSSSEPVAEAPSAAAKEPERPKPPWERKQEPKGPDAFDRAAAWLADRGALPALGVLTLVIFVIHAHTFTGETAGDDLSFHFAESARLMDCLRKLDFDFWNPSANGGYASAYYYQVIPQMASALPAAIFGHHLFWFQLTVVLPIVLAPAAAYKGMRLLGATPWQAFVAAFCVAFMNGDSRWGAGNAGTYQVGLYTQTWALCAFPLALGYAVKWMTEGTRLASAIAWGAFVFLCHPFGGVTLAFALIISWLIQFPLMAVDALLRAIAPKLVGRWTWLDHLATRWQHPPLRQPLEELVRAAILGGLLVITWMPIWLPLLIDGQGFGGFPHRVPDEVGPGFKVLGRWYVNGQLMDWVPKDMGLRRIGVLTWAFPVALLFARAKYLRWLWTPALLFALLLGAGPHIGKIGDDVFPPVRFLGGMQTAIAMGVGASAILIGGWLWKNADKLRWPYAIRTILASATAGLLVIVVFPGSQALGARVRVYTDNTNSHRDEMGVLNLVLTHQPQARKQPGPGADNHWWNLLTYAYGRVPTTLQMGGGGLQASPNYDFLWTQRDFTKTAWIYDAPYVMYMASLGSRLPKGDIIAKTANYEIRRLPSPGLVSPVRVTGELPPGYHHDQAGHKAALDWIRGDKPMKDEVLAYAGDKGNRDAQAGRTLRSWRQDSGGSDADIVAEVEADKTTTFMIRESWHPRWHAYLDGNEVRVRRVTPDFPAVDVPPGKHTIELRFERPWWMHAAWLAWPLLALAAWWWQRRRVSAVPS